MQEQVEKCRQCGNVIHVNTGYVTWCEKCGWNIDPNTLIIKKSTKYKLHKFINKTWSKSLLYSMLNKNTKNKRISSFQRIVMYIYALLIYALCSIVMFSLLLGGIYLVANGILYYTFPGNFAALLFGFICFFIFYLLIPKPSKLKIDSVKREDFPLLFFLVDRIADNMGIEKTIDIVIDHEFNASFYKTILTNRNVLNIGLPLFYILKPSEKVALLSHELAHDANKDIDRGNFIKIAQHILSKLYILLDPNYNDYAEVAVFALAGPLVVIVKPVRWLLSKLVLGMLSLFFLLTWRDDQRAEYLADGLAAKTAGSEAVMSMLNKIHFGDSFLIMLSNISEYKYISAPLLEYKKRIANIPGRELERISRLEKEYLSAVDSSHPPTFYRLKYIEGFKCDPKIVLTEDENRQLEDELEKIREKIEKKLLTLCKIE